MKKGIPFDCSDFSVEGLKLSFLDSGGSKPPLHFSHANGFPVSMYLPFLTELAESFRVVGLSLRGQDGLSPGLSDWHRAALDLVEFLEARALGPVMGVGHSIGAVTTLLAASRRPDLFRSVVLLDPPLFPPKWILLLRLSRWLGQKKRFPPAARARRRRNGWRDRQEALEYFRAKDMFRGWKEEYLRAYVTYGLRPGPDGGMVLVCPPEAEALGFESYPLDVWSWVSRLRLPALLVRGRESDVLRKETCRRFCRLSDGARWVEVEGTGHFIPMQNPEATIGLIADFDRSAACAEDRAHRAP